MQAPEPTNQFGKTFAIIAWLLVMVLLYLFFQDTIDTQLNPNQQLHSVTGAGGETRTVLMRNNSGHYVGTALINNAEADFMLDTGATTIAISEAAARRLNLPFGRKSRVATANGITVAYDSVVASLQLGDIMLTDIDAMIVPGLTNTEILLGMSALKQLEFHQQGDRLTLIQHR